MPHPKPKNPGIGKTPEENMRRAIYDVMEGGLSKKAAATKHSIPRTTLRRYLKKFQNKDDIDWSSEILEGAPRLTPNYSVNQIFSVDEEKELSKYLQTGLHHGLNPKGARKLAFDLAVANNKKMPISWEENQTAGKFWFTAFMKRNPELSLRSAEATSLGRAMGFNRPVVDKFFKSLKEIYERYSFTPSQIYNVDETALTTVHETGKVLARKGQKQVGHIVSNERGTLVTMCGAINAIGNSVPPFLIFPRKYFKDCMIKNAPPGTLGVASSSGWMTAELFVQWMEHFIKHSKPTQASPVLLIMDNHESHISLETIKLAKRSNIILLTLPPHTSHRLQPLDKYVYGPLKKYYNHECQSWLLRNPGKRITIYDIAENLRDAYQLAFCPKNSIAAFKATGIFPYNDQIFSGDDFMAAIVTDIVHVQEAETKENSVLSGNDIYGDKRSELNNSFPSTSFHQHQKTPEKSFISPEIINPYPKASLAPVKQHRKKKTTEILTDTPIYNKIEEESAKKRARQDGIKKQKSVKRKISSGITKKKSESSESNSDLEMVDVLDSDDVDAFLERDKSSDDETELQTIKVKSFVLVQFNTKKTRKYYVAKVTETLDDDEYMVTFLRRHGMSFSYPKIPDCVTISKQDVVLRLPQPKTSDGTNRTANLLAFSIDLTAYNIC